MPIVTTTTPLGVDPDAVYAVLADPLRYPEWAPGGGEARPAGGAVDAGSATVVSVVDSPAGRLEQHVEYRFDAATRTVEFAPAASSPSPGFAGAFAVASDGQFTYTVRVPDGYPSADAIAGYLQSTSMPEFVAALRARLA